jgi:hypothetical protein
MAGHGKRRGAISIFLLKVTDPLRVEVKNQLGYIDQTESDVKLSMCRFWDLRPMFVARVMPANYGLRTNALELGFSALYPSWRCNR